MQVTRSTRPIVIYPGLSLRHGLMTRRSLLHRQLRSHKLLTSTLLSKGTQIRRMDRWTHAPGALATTLARSTTWFMCRKIRKTASTKEVPRRPWLSRKETRATGTSTSRHQIKLSSTTSMRRSRESSARTSRESCATLLKRPAQKVLSKTDAGVLSWAHCSDSSTSSTVTQWRFGSASRKKVHRLLTLTLMTSRVSSKPNQD